MNMFLSADELFELTGYRSSQGQRRWLDQAGWRYAVARDGSPRVARAYCLAKLGVEAGVEAAPASRQPNWGAIR